MDFVDPDPGAADPMRLDGEDLRRALAGEDDLSVADVVDDATLVNSGTASANLAVSPVPVGFLTFPDATTPTLSSQTVEWLVEEPLFAVTQSEFGPILDFRELTFDDVVRAIEDTASYLEQIDAPQLVDPLPLVNMAASDLSEYATRFRQFADDVANKPVATVGELQMRLAELLGLAASEAPLRATHDADGVALRLDLPLTVIVDMTVPLDIDFTALDESIDPEEDVINSLVGLSSRGDLNLTSEATLGIQLGIDLAVPGGATVLVEVANDETADFDSLEDLRALIQTRLDMVLDVTPGYAAGDVAVQIIGGEIVFVPADPDITGATGPDLPSPANGRLDEPTSVDIATIAPGGPGVDEVQTVTVNAVGGTFILEVEALDDEGNPMGLSLTMPIALGADAANVQAALEGPLGEGNVLVTRSDGTYTITYVGTAGGRDILEPVVLLDAGEPQGLIGGLAIAIDLEGATGQALAPFLFDGLGPGATTLDVELLVVGDELDFSAQAGPLELMVRSLLDTGPAPSCITAPGAPGACVRIHGSGDPAQGAMFQLQIAPDDGDGRHALADLAGLLADTLVDEDGVARANLPLFQPDGDETIGTLRAEVDNLFAPASVFEFAPADPDDPDADELEDFLAEMEDEIVGDLLESPNVLVDGLDRLLSRLQAAVDSEVFAVPIPFVGDGLGQATQFIADFRDSLLTVLNYFLRRPDPILSPQALVQQLLFDIFGPGEKDLKARKTEQSINVDTTQGGGNYRLSLGNARDVVTTVTEGEPGVNEVQTLQIVDADGGTFRVRRTDPFDSTIPIALDASAAELNNALESIYGQGNIDVARNGGVFTITFQGALAGQDVKEISVDTAGLIDTVFETVPLSPFADEDTLRMALEELGNIGPGNVEVVGDLIEGTMKYVVTFVGDLKDVNVKSLTTSDPEESRVSINVKKEGGKGTAAVPLEIGNVSFGGLNILKKLNSKDAKHLSRNDIQIKFKDGGVFFRMNLGEEDVLPRILGFDPGFDVSFDLGLPAIGLDLDAKVDISLGWEFDFNFGISKDFGFYTETELKPVGAEPKAKSPPELRVTLGASLKGEDDKPASVTGNLGPLTFVATDKISSVPGGKLKGDRLKNTLLSGTFSVDIKDPDRGVLAIPVTEDGVLPRNSTAKIKIPVLQADGTTKMQELSFTVNRSETLDNNQRGSSTAPAERLAEDVQEALNQRLVAMGFQSDAIKVTFDPFTNSFALAPGEADDTDDGVTVEVLQDGVAGTEGDDLVKVQTLQNGNDEQNEIQQITFSDMGLTAASRQRPYVITFGSNGLDGAVFPSDLGRLEVAPVSELAIKVARQGHPRLHVRDTTVLQTGPNTFKVTFKSGLGLQDIPQMIIEREGTGAGSAADPVDEQQLITFGADATASASSPFLIMWKSPQGNEMPDGLGKIETISELGIRVALQGHPDIQVSSVRVFDQGSRQFLVTFRGNLGGTDVNRLLIRKEGDMSGAPNTIDPNGKVEVDLDGDKFRLREIISPIFSLRETLVATVSLDARANLALEIFFGKQGERNAILPKITTNFHYKQKFLELSTGVERSSFGREPFPISKDGKLDRNIDFFLSINGTDVKVQVTKSDTTTNRTIFDLVDDVQRRVNVALFSTEFSGAVKVKYDSQQRQIVFEKDPDTKKRITSINFRLKGKGPEVGFTRIALDLGSFIGDFAGPILRQIEQLVGPLGFLIDPDDGLLFQPLPVISDLAGEDVTLLTLARVFG
ncbi:MAG: hypothetical protein ACYTGC_07765, partial [Planctomycetota bacterium]